MATLGVTGTATIATGVVTTANITNSTTSGTANIATANITTLGVTGSTTLSNLNIGTVITANLQANTSTLLFNANTLANGTINATSYTGTSANATLFAGQTLATIQNQITGNAATAYSNAVANSANATNITSGTIGAGFLPASTVNTSGAFTIGGVLNHTANLVVTGNTTAVLTVGNNLTTNVTSNATTLTVQAGATIGAVTVNSTTITVGNATVSTTVNATSFSGTAAQAANATNLNSQPASYYTNATNITTGTLGAGFLPTTIVNTSAAFTIGGIFNYTANLVVTGNTTAVLTVGNNNTSNITANATALTIQGTAAVGSILANSTQITVGNASVSATINSTAFSGLAANATYANAAGALGNTSTGLIPVNTSTPTDGYVLAYDSATSKVIFKNPSNITTALNSNVITANAQLQAGSNGSTYVANLYGNATTTAATFRANVVSFQVDSGSILLNSSANVNGTLTVGTGTGNNTTVNATTITVGNAVTSTTINATSFSGTAANAALLGGLSLAVIQGNAASNATQAYINAIAIAANATNITSGTIGSGFLPAAVVNTSGAFTIAGVLNYTANLVVTGNTTSVLAVGNNNTSNITANATTLTVQGTAAVGSTSANSTVVNVGNATVYTTINATSFSGTANNSSAVGGNTASTLRTYSETQATNAYTQAIANSANATNITSGTIGAGFLPTTIVNTSGAFTIGGILNYTANLVVTGNTTAVLTVGNNNTSNITANAVALTVQGTAAVGSVTANSTQITVGNATIQTTINATSFSGIAANASLLGGTSLTTLQSQITGNAATAFANAIANAASNAAGIYQTTAGLSANVATLTSANATLFAGQTLATVQSYVTTNASAAYINAIAIAANATNITSGTVAPARLGSGTTDSTTILYGNGVWASVGGIATNTAAQYAWTNTQSFAANVTFVSGNATNQLLVGTIGSGNGVAIQNTGIQIGNTGQSVTINSTAFSGTANNSLFLGGTNLATIQSQITGNAATAFANAIANAASNAAGIYQTTAGLSANVATLSANQATYLGNSQGTWANTLALIGTAFSNAIANAYSNAQATYFLKSGGTIAGGVTITGDLQVNGTTLYANVTNLDVTDKNITVAKGAASNAASDGAGLTVDIPNATLTYSGSANTWNVNRGFSPTANLTFDLGGSTLFWQGVYANTINLTGGATLNATFYSGTAANASALSSVSLATIQSQITGNAATAYSNAVANAIANSANATNITSGTIGAGFLPASTVNTSGAFTIGGVLTHSANILFSGNTTSQVLVGTIAAGNGVAITNGSITIGNNSVNATINSTSFTGTVTQASNATNLNSQPASYYTNATNITTGTLPIAQIPSAVVNTSGAFTLGGVFTFNSNVSLASGNATNQVLVGTIAAGNGVVISNTGIQIGNTGQSVTINSTAFSGSSNNAGFLGGSTLATIQSQITGNAATAFSNAIANAASSAAALYQTTAGLSANVATLSAGSVGGNTATTLRAYSDTAYTNATAIAANATNLANGTVPVARLGSSGTRDSTTVLYGNNIWAAIVAGSTLVANTTDTQTFYLPMANTTSGAWANAVVATSKLSFVPSTGVLSATSFTGSGAGLSALGTSTGYQVGSLGVGTAASGTAGEIRATNNISAYYSDKRLKENIIPISDALSKVMQISGVTFNSNETAAKFGYTDKKSQVGVVAQEIEAVLPQIVVPAPFDIGQDDDGNEYSLSGENYKTVQYDKLVPLLIEAIKQLKSELDEVKSRK